MEEKKKHIEFHVDIDEAANQLSVQIVAEKPTTGELLVCCIAVVKCVIETVARTGSAGKQKALRKIADVLCMISDETHDEEES